MTSLVTALERIPHSLIALLGRFSIAATFWQSGQTKIEGLVIDPIGGDIKLGWPRLAESTIPLFEEEYRLPVLPPEFAAYAAATAEHVFPVLLLLGLATRLSAFALLLMTLTIQVFVYPAAYATHGVWATVLLYLMARGGGRYSLDASWSSRLPAAGASGLRA
jgi:putative oxidoreductase